MVATMQGEQRVEDLIAFNVVDSTLHSWDLARAAGVDERLDASLVEQCTALLDAMPAGRAGFGAPVDVASDDPQEALLAASGRSVGIHT